MRRLPPDVRLKAIEIANAMLAEGYDDGRAIRMAIAAARKWAWGATYHRLHNGAMAVLSQRPGLAANVRREEW
jgi:uncharacterized protein YdaT